jgi:ribosomal protein L23
MSEIVKLSSVENKVIIIRGKHILIDRDVADLYNVEVKKINQAVSRNPDKFPEGYIIQLNSSEKNELVTNCDRFDTLKHSSVMPRAFTEKALYMLATILKSPVATQVTIEIVETFVRLHEFGRVINQLPDIKDEHQKQTLTHKCGILFGGILDNIGTISSETTVELNLAVVKVKHSIKREKRKKDD